MIAENWYFGGGVAESDFSVVGGILILVAIALMFLLPRKYVIIPTLLAVFLVPRGQVLVVAGVHLMPVRIISFFGWIRLASIKFASQENLFVGRLNEIDKAFSCWAIFHALAFTLRWMNSSALINQIGFLWTTFGMYYFLRYLIQDYEDIYIVIKVFAIILFINTVGMIFEQWKNQNMFGIYIGGVQGIPFIRDGRIRSQGAFGISILAGTCAAFLLPLFLILWKNAKARYIAIIGATSSAVVVFTSASSTSYLACFAGMVAIFLWPLRESMRLFRWGIVIALIGLHLIMKAPVWFLIRYMDVTGASSGFHRAKIVDLFISNFFDWWLIGTKEIGNWGWEMWDLSNSYVAEGESGGLLAFIFFILVIIYSFKRLGGARKNAKGNLDQEWFMWALSASIFSNVIAFFGISYWDQTQVAWFSLLAIISTATENRLPLSEKDLKVELIR